MTQVPRQHQVCAATEDEQPTDHDRNGDARDQRGHQGKQTNDDEQYAEADGPPNRLPGDRTQGTLVRYIHIHAVISCEGALAVGTAYACSASIWMRRLFS